MTAHEHGKRVPISLGDEALQQPGVTLAGVGRLDRTLQVVEHSIEGTAGHCRASIRTWFIATLS